MNKGRKLELELIQTQMAQKPKQVRNDSGGGGKSALAKFPGKFAKSEIFVGVAHSRTPQNNKEDGARAKKLVTCGTRGPLGRV